MKIKITKKVLFSVLLIVCLLFLFIYLGSKKSDTPISSVSVIAYKNLVPGKSTKEEVVSSLGTPDKESVENEIIKLEYKSNNPNFRNELLIENDNLFFVKEIITQEDRIGISTLSTKYGKPDLRLYGPGSINGFDLYVYLNQGVGYIGNQNLGEVIEIWYFTPMDIDNFLSTHAQEYSEELQPTQ